MLVQEALWLDPLLGCSLLVFAALSTLSGIRWLLRSEPRDLLAVVLFGGLAIGGFLVQLGRLQAAPAAAPSVPELSSQLLFYGVIATLGGLAWAGQVLFWRIAERFA